MKRLKFLIAVGTVLVATSLRLHAQTGCEDSPENPTAILALIGSVAALGDYARRRFLAGRGKKDNS